MMVGPSGSASGAGLKPVELLAVKSRSDERRKKVLGTTRGRWVSESRSKANPRGRVDSHACRQNQGRSTPLGLVRQEQDSLGFHGRHQQVQRFLRPHSKQRRWSELATVLFETSILLPMEIEPPIVQGRRDLASDRIGFQGRRVAHRVQCAVEKALVNSGWKSRPGAGSFRPVTTEAAMEVTKLLKPSGKGSHGDSVSMQVVTRVNAEQASKRAMQEPTQLDLGEGRSRWNGTSERVPRSCRGSGDGMQATGTRRNTGNPSGDRKWNNRRLVRGRLGRLGWRRGP